jgi:hypothetical protein
MYTSIVLAALMGSSSVPAAAPVVWQDDYGVARKEGSRANKPLAVFFGKGSSAWQKVSQSEKISPEVQKLLARHYVCVYVDTSQGYGRRLARSFAMPTGSGLVLSTRGGESQAFRHEGQLSSSQLRQTLNKYADANLTVTRTETLASERVSYSYTPNSTNGTPGGAPVNRVSGYSGSSGYSGAPVFMGGFRSGGGGC